LKYRNQKKIKLILWAIIFLFLVLIISFPKWITVFYPLPHQDIVFANAQEFNIDPYLVFAIIRAESKYQNAARSPVGARGLMQIMPETGQWIAEQLKIKDFEPEDLHDPEVNIRFGCWYINYLNSEFKGQIPLELAAYNAGKSKVKQWVRDGKWDGDSLHMEGIPFPETRQYVEKVLSNYEAYKSIYAERQGKT
jgi:soluble lytic murein transglycosylase